MNFLVNPISLRRSASKMVGGGKIPVRIKPHTHQRRLEVSSKPRAHQDPETPQRMRQSCVWVSPVQGRVSSGLPQGQGLQVQQTWVWHKPSWRRLPLTHHRATRTYTGLGKQTLGGHKQNPGCIRTQEKGAVTPRETARLAQESPVEAWVGGGPLQGRGHWVQQCMLGTFRRRSPLSSSPSP